MNSGSQKNNRRPDVLYGINPVREAVGVRPMEYVLIAQGHHSPRIDEIVQLCRDRGVPVRLAPHQALERMAGGAHHQNVAAVCSAKGYDELETLLDGVEQPLLVVLDGVEDPANLGAVIRTAVAAGANGALIPERRAAGLSGAVARSASGALEHLKIARATNLTRSLLDLKKKNVWIYGFEARAEASYLDLDYRTSCALVFGGEGRGLHRLVREACDQVARVPIYGPVESLNISAAAAVVLYEAARQRR